ncbi:hypothetical protein D5400_11585 [Georhizobium profundi]|uniref:Uncharacterized protein n=1 Tax=Georhizobium profundi TaxID=2341112 RepID=A0A3Q8XNS7_9HYPH|nr:hypothetical protein [Georhizobium profundi]AZN71830.1 hypothetical protein D5400_11585 [Georhizobium profundi]
MVSSLHQLLQWIPAVIAFVVATALGAAAIWPEARAAIDPIWNWVISNSLPASMLSVLTAALWFWAWNLTAPRKREPQMTGDNYNNFGSNYGHIGPVNNYGDRRLEFNEALGQDLLVKVPKDKPLAVLIVGPSARAWKTGRQIVEFLTKHGYQVDEDSVQHLTPMPSHPLTYDGKTLTIAADVTLPRA